MKKTIFKIPVEVQEPGTITLLEDEKKEVSSEEIEDDNSDINQLGKLANEVAKYNHEQILKTETIMKASPVGSKSFILRKTITGNEETNELFGEDF